MLKVTLCGTGDEKNANTVSAAIIMIVDEKQVGFIDGENENRIARVDGRNSPVKIKFEKPEYANNLSLTFSVEIDSAPQKSSESSQSFMTNVKIGGSINLGNISQSN
jgi:hypothetical protein